MPVIINGTTGISGTDGSAGTPAVQGTDTNTGMFFPAADTIAFSEGGVESMRLDSSGNVTLAGNLTLGGSFVPGSSFLRNRIINGDMRIDQRNAGAAVTVNNASVNVFVVDRWDAAGETSDGVYTLQRQSGGPSGFTNFIRATVTTADASIGASQRYSINHRIEGHNVDDLGWGAAGASSITVSFWVRSSLTGTFGGSIRNSAGNRSYPYTYSISAANTWERKTITISGDTTGTWLTDNGLGLWFMFDLGSGSSLRGTAGSWAAADLRGATGSVSLISTLSATFDVTGVQLEVGSVATPFERRQFGQELALCQRYYAKSYNTNVAVPSISNDGVIITTATTTNIGGIGASIQFPVEMRAPPTMTFYSPTSLTAGLWRDGGSGTDKAVVVYVGTGTRATQVLNNANWSGVGAAGFGHYAASAELI